MQTTMIKVNELCPEIDNVIADDSIPGTVRVKRIYDYINDYMQNVTIIYPNTFAPTIGLYLSFFNRLKSFLDSVEDLEQEKKVIISYFQNILFDVDLSVIK